MGYACTAAALHTLQVIKALHGADLEPNNEIRAMNGRLVFFEREGERADGAIVGTVRDLQGKVAGGFHIAPDGRVVSFAGLNQMQHRFAEVTAQNPAFRANWRAVI